MGVGLVLRLGLDLGFVQEANRDRGKSWMEGKYFRHIDRSIAPNLLLNK